jgi:hypothetical protein
VELSIQPDGLEVFVLTGQQDWLNLLWSLKSFYWFSGGVWPLTILDDGTLTNAEDDVLMEHFPRARIIRAVTSEAVISGMLADYPLCQRYRSLHPLARKAFDAGALLRAPRMLLLDSDLLFFREPTELVRRIDATDDPNCFNADVAPGLNISEKEAKIRFSIALNVRINSGLCLLSNRVFNLDWMEEFLSCQSIWNGHIWRIEQTLLALAASRDGVELLPECEYRVSLEPGTKGCVVKHYVGAVRHLMYREGIAKLVREGFLDQVGNEQRVADEVLE